jgi:CheY-like chemotaxis protein
MDADPFNYPFNFLFGLAHIRKLPGSPDGGLASAGSPGLAGEQHLCVGAQTGYAPRQIMHDRLTEYANPATAIALRKFQILMDINLPGISGIQALKILREDPVTAHIPALVISASAMPRDIKKGLEAGFFRYLTKPIKVNGFMDALDMALELAETGLDGAINPGSP